MTKNKKSPAKKKVVKAKPKRPYTKKLTPFVEAQSSPSQVGPAEIHVDFEGFDFTLANASRVQKKLYDLKVEAKINEKGAGQNTVMLGQYFRDRMLKFKTVAAGVGTVDMNKQAFILVFDSKHLHSKSLPLRKDMAVQDRGLVMKILHAFGFKMPLKNSTRLTVFFEVKCIQETPDRYIYQLILQDSVKL